MKTLLITISLVATLYFKWDSVPEPIRKATEKVGDVIVHVFENGSEMPAEVDVYVNKKTEEIEKKVVNLLE